MWTGIWVASATRRSRPARQRAAAGQDDALVHDVGDQLGRGLLDRVLDRVDDLLDGRLDRLADLVGATSTLRGRPVSRSRPRSVDALGVPLARVGRADRDLDVLGVRSPRNRLYSRAANVTMSWSISSPPIRIER
jgi:hypothetical protein